MLAQQSITRPTPPGNVPLCSFLMATGSMDAIENIPSYSVPALGISLARQGYVAVSWDMLGYNDARQIPHDFGGHWREQLWSFNPLGLQLWNSIRVLDYVVTRPDVDNERIACTGASGGATQTILLTAVDSRVSCAVPVNMVSASYQGADPCEEAPNLRLGSNNVEIASMTAPRPMLLVSCTGDWTRNTPTVEFPAIQSIYRLYNKPNAIAERAFRRRTQLRSPNARDRLQVSCSPDCETTVHGTTAKTT